MKIAIIALVAGTTVLSACVPVGGPGVSSYYDCGSGTRLKVDYLDGDRVLVQMNNNPPVTLPAERSASGGKYMSPMHQFWTKGDEAIWTVGRAAPMTCKQVVVPRGV
jgi:membrane-bound inhibitor of C-type lysozyme